MNSKDLVEGTEVFSTASGRRSEGSSILRGSCGTRSNPRGFE